jgi:effector-binding domain-containing protein
VSELILSSAIETPSIITSQPMLIAKLYAKIPTREIRSKMGQLLQELSAELKRQQIPPAGSWFTHHLQAPAEYFDFEVCFPVATSIEASGRVQPGQWPAMKMVRTVYHGAYAGLAKGWSDFMSEIERMGLRVSPEIWEVYKVGPDTEGNPENWRTELIRAIV